MLFKLHPDTPKFQVFVLLNQELIYFLNKSIKQQRFGRRLFSYTDVGKACWENSKANDPTAENELTCDKFRNLFECLKIESLTVRQNLYQVMILNQDFEAFFASPTPNLLSFLSKASLKAFKNIFTLFNLGETNKHKKPKAFLLENVKNLKTHDKGHTIKVIYEHLTNL